MDSIRTDILNHIEAQSWRAETEAGNEPRRRALSDVDASLFSSRVR
jgi:hypothetical protein